MLGLFVIRVNMASNLADRVSNHMNISIRESYLNNRTDALKITSRKEMFVYAVKLVSPCKAEDFMYHYLMDLSELIASDRIQNTAHIIA